ncbi:MAG: hypothetical protein LiPW30_733, partial [Parcubacteria group bacterium LiPW_30]
MRGGYFTATGNLGTTGNTAHYGLYSATTGTADTNYGIYLSSSGATTNWALYNAAGNMFMGVDSAISYYGAGSDATITFDGDSLNIVANAVTGTDTLNITAASMALGSTPITTTGAIGGGAITGTSFVIGANTISSFVNLDSLADLSYVSASFVKMTAAGTFALDTAVYMTNPMDAIGQIIYGGASGAPTKLAAGSSGQILVSGGAGAPAWSTATYPATAA